MPMKVSAATKIQYEWKAHRLKKDMTDDIEPPNDDDVFEPLEYEGVMYQMDDGKVYNMDGEHIGEIENGIVVFQEPYDTAHAVKAQATVSDGEETDDCEDSDDE